MNILPDGRVFPSIRSCLFGFPVYFWGRSVDGILYGGVFGQGQSECECLSIRSRQKWPRERRSYV